MSSSSLSMPFLVPRRSRPVTVEDASQDVTSNAPRPLVRRRPTMQQGRALEALGHAIEYLVDSRMFLVDRPYTLAEPDAIQILSRSSREVFATCAEAVPMAQRLMLWASGRLGVPLPQSPMPIETRKI